ncbi:MAG: MFS transporter [Anaerolineae bacterium]|nr:MFS transporter [Anaerolineae bacterium]
MQMGRFVAAEVNPPDKRGRAISYVVLGGTVGSVLGPLLVGPSGRLATSVGMDELVGPYLAGLIVFGLAALVIFALLNPDPREIGRAVAELHPETVVHPGVTRAFSEMITHANRDGGIAAMVFGQVVMVGLMGITSLHMRGHNHELDAISLAFSAHTLGMFAFSVLSGRLADRWGRGPVILLGAGMLLVACALAPLSPELLPLSLALFLLGLGWNLCYVGGSALLSDILSPAERATSQGASDLIIGLATAAGEY